MMDDGLKRALAAAARVFADEIERDLPPREPMGSGAIGGSAGSMSEVLRSVARINDGEGRGASDEDMRSIARRVGMDPRGLAGYYSAHLLEKRDDGRWICAEGRERLGRIDALRRAVLLDADAPTSPADC